MSCNRKINLTFNLANVYYQVLTDKLGIEAVKEILMTAVKTDYQLQPFKESLDDLLLSKGDIMTDERWERLLCACRVILGDKGERNHRIFIGETNPN